MLSAVQIFISKSSLWWLNCHILTSRELLTYWKYLVGDSLFDRIAVVNSILRDLVLEIPTSCNSNKEFWPFLTRWKRWSKLLFVKANFLQFPCFGQKRTFKHITYYTIIERVVITVLKVSSPVSEFQLKAALVPLSTLILVAPPGNNSILGLSQYSNKAFKVEVISKVRDIQSKEYIGCDHHLE